MAPSGQLPRALCWSRRERRSNAAGSCRAGAEIAVPAAPPSVALARRRDRRRAGLKERCPPCAASLGGGHHRGGLPRRSVPMAGGRTTMLAADEPGLLAACALLLSAASAGKAGNRLRERALSAAARAALLCGHRDRSAQSPNCAPPTPLIPDSTRSCRSQEPDMICGAAARAANCWSRPCSRSRARD